MSYNYYKPADWNAICDSCGFKFKASELQKRWDGFMVCKKDWEPRHIAEFIKAPRPAAPIPWSRPEPADTFVTVPYISNTVGSQDTTVPVVTPGNGSTT